MEHLIHVKKFPHLEVADWEWGGIEGVEFEMDECVESSSKKML